MTDSANWSDWQLLAQVSQVYRTTIDNFMDRVDMHRAQAILLCTVYNQDGMTQSEIADELAVQGATITNMLQRMEEAQLVIRRRDAQDNRLVRVYLTDLGREKERAINQKFAELEASIFAGMTAEDRITFRRLLWQVMNNMNQPE